MAIRQLLRLLAGRTLARLIGLMAIAGALIAFPASAAAQEETVSNNLSFPAIWSEGVTLPLNGTFGAPVLQTPTVITDSAGDPLTLYLQGDPTNTWQAENIVASAPVDVSQVDWGDNLEARSFPPGQQIRVETTLIEDLATPMLGFTMYSASGSQSTEVFGTDGTTYMSPQATIYSTCARLTIQRLEISRDDPYISRITWDPTTSTWTGRGLIAAPIFNGGVWAGGEGTGYSAEVNGSGKAIYGFNWQTTGLTAGDYRITFSLDPYCPVATLNTFITPSTSVFMTSETEGVSTANVTSFAGQGNGPGGSGSGGGHDSTGDTGGEPVGAVAQLDPANNLSYIDVELGTPYYPEYVPPPPVNTVKPSVTGTTTEGYTLKATAGTWDNSPTSYAYQWQRCDTAGAQCTNITGATASTYTLVATDVGHTMRIRVTAHNADGSTSAVSAVTATVLPDTPVNTTRPKILGTKVNGEVLVATKGAWANNPTSFTFQWQICDRDGTGCTDLAGATSGRLTLDPALVGHRLRVRVTATNAGGSTSIRSRITSVIYAKPKANVTMRLRWTSEGLLRLSGRVSPAHNGRMLKVQKRTRTGWKTVAKVRLRQANMLRSRYRITLSNGSPGLYRVRLRADSAHRASISKKVRARALARVTVHLHQLEQDRFRLWGSVSPARTGKKLMIQRHTKTGWKTVTTMRLRRTVNHRSRYAIAVNHAVKGKYRVRFGGDDAYRPSNSRVVTFR